MMDRWRILMVNIGLSGRSGTEMHLRDHALAYLRRGHAVMVYAPVVGPLADEIARAGGEVRTTLDGFAQVPDIIHGNHHVQLVETMLRYRETPAVYMCHDGTCWNARAPLFSRIQSYLAVDWNCRERVSRETGFLLEEIPVVSNTVDLAVFSPRTALPARPRRILIFGRETHSITYLRSVKAACALVGLKPDVISEGVRAWTDQPATVLAQYDIVVAKARCALEALAVGCHVILCSSSGLGPGITMENFETLYRWNLGTRLLTEPASPAAIRQRMESYSPLRTLALRDRVRSTCGVEHSADQLLRIYTKAMARFQERPRPTTGEELASLNRYFLSLEQELHQFDSRVIQAHYRGIARRLMRHLRTRPRLRRFLKKIWYWMARD